MKSFDRFFSINLGTAIFFGVVPVNLFLIAFLGSAFFGLYPMESVGEIVLDWRKEIICLFLLLFALQWWVLKKLLTGPLNEIQSFFKEGHVSSKFKGFYIKNYNNLFHSFLSLKEENEDMGQRLNDYKLLEKARSQRLDEEKKLAETSEEEKKNLLQKKEERIQNLMEDFSRFEKVQEEKEEKIKTLETEKNRLAKDLEREKEKNQRDWVEVKNESVELEEDAQVEIPKKEEKRKQVFPTLNFSSPKISAKDLEQLWDPEPKEKNEDEWWLKSIADEGQIIDSQGIEEYSQDLLSLEKDSREKKNHIRAMGAPKIVRGSLPV